MAKELNKRMVFELNVNEKWDKSLCQLFVDKIVPLTLRVNDTIRSKLPAPPMQFMKILNRNNRDRAKVSEAVTDCAPLLIWLQATKPWPFYLRECEHFKPICEFVNKGIYFQYLEAIDF